MSRRPERSDEGRRKPPACRRRAESGRARVRPAPRAGSRVTTSHRFIGEMLAPGVAQCEHAQHVFRERASENGCWKPATKPFAQRGPHPGASSRPHGPQATGQGPVGRPGGDGRRPVPRRGRPERGRAGPAAAHTQRSTSCRVACHRGQEASMSRMTSGDARTCAARPTGAPWRASWCRHGFMWGGWSHVACSLFGRPCVRCARWWLRRGDAPLKPRAFSASAAAVGWAGGGRHALGVACCTSGAAAARLADAH